MHPILIEFSNDFYIATYGFMIAVGLITAILLATWRGRIRGFQPDVFSDLAFVGVISGFLSARLLFILLNFNEFLRYPMAMIFSRAGFVFLGGLIGAVAACIIYVRRKGLPILAVGDVAAPSIAIAHAFGRVGCHLVGCCWGGICEVPRLGLRVPRQPMPGGEYFENAALHYPGEFINGVLYSQPVWPVQLMESIMLFVLAAGLLLFASKPRRAGQTLALYLAGYAVLRFVLEYFRGDEDRGLFFGDLISTSQLLSLALIPAALGIWWYSRNKGISVFSHPSVAPKVAEAEAQKNSDTADKAAASPRRRRRSGSRK